MVFTSLKARDGIKYGARAISLFLPRVALPIFSRQHIDAGQAAFVKERAGAGHDEMPLMSGGPHGIIPIEKQPGG